MPCREGGTVSWSVDVGAYRSAERDSLSLGGTLGYSACTSIVDWTSQLSGGVEWSVDGESGTCAVDLQTDITVTGVGDTGRGSIDATTSGRVCNRTIERSFTLQSSS